MRKLIEKFFLAGVFALTLQSAWGFVVVGDVGNKGDAWQTIDIGYGWADPVAPKDIYEEYRPIVPVLYYASDASFISYFGTMGLTNIDAAFAVLNGVMLGQTNIPVFLSSPTSGITLAANGNPGGSSLTFGTGNTLDSYSADLSEFPLESQQINFTAQTLGLWDMKSTTLHLMLLELGLGNPDRYVWTLHDRLPNPLGLTSPQCPGDVEYLVVQRNYDVNPFQNFVYSPYINGSLFTFIILENCGNKQGVPWTAITAPYPADPFASQYTAVASGGLLRGFVSHGKYYTGLTRDDAAGLKYLLSTNNINWEASAPGGGLLQLTNVQTPIAITTLPFSILLDNTLTTVAPPSTLLSQYPGLTILSTITNYLAQVITTNFFPYFTNQSIVPLYSNTVPGGLPAGLNTTNIYYFTNQPGPTVVNYDTTPTFITTLDLANFADLVNGRTNDPATLLAAYPGLIISSQSNYLGWVYTTNYVTYLTNKIGSPYGSPPILVTVPVTGYAWQNYWNYTFVNVFTNHFYTNRLVTVQDTWVTNWIGAPYPNTFTNIKTAIYTTNLVSGDFFLLQTNWCGFDLIASFPKIATFGATNVVSSSLTNSSTGYSVTRRTYDGFTNYNYAVKRGICEPMLVLGTNYTTNYLNTYKYYFGGIVTNSYYSNTWTAVYTTNASPFFGGSPGQLQTNGYATTNFTGIPSGDFFIPDPTWCAYTVLSNLLTNVVFTTNVVTSVNQGSGNDVGQFYQQTTVTAYTNHTLLVRPSLCSQATAPKALRRGIGRVQFIRANYDSLLGQYFLPQTNYYSMVMITNGQPVTEYYQRVVLHPDFLFQAEDLTVPTPEFPYGPDYNVTFPQFDQSAITTQLAGPGTITPNVVMVFNKNMNVYLNGSLNNYGLSTNQFLNQNTQGLRAAWGSFDGSTNYPVVYPDSGSIISLMNQMVIQVTPASVPDGSVGVPYNGGLGVTFTATGGQPPYVWAAPNLSAQVPGMSFNTATATLNGTPFAAGTFSFTVQLTDSANRVVTLNYSITTY